MKNAGDAQAKDNLERILECLDKERCTEFQDCITWARLKFEDYFVNRVKQLTFTFPEDATTSNGTPFWSAPKRFPLPLQFSTDDVSHLHFIMAASFLRAEIFGIPVPDWVKSPKKLADAVSNVIVPNFQPKEDVKIETDEKATNIPPPSVDDALVIDELIMKLENCQQQLLPGFRMNPIQFEKDDDTNYHMDLIAGLANMRARNYGIPEVDKLKAKFIAKDHPSNSNLHCFGNWPEPVPPKVIKHQDMSWEVGKAELPPYRRHLDVVVACEDDEDNDIDIPQISIYFR
ncbi:hypothetical protein GH714_018112 [Hevea brasiliensis]|uniref:Ubiquitin-activating enzyme SCCH domain-containing protein n=1 Tax=Hevea brasiliensis TaxID=3981 RepID=A0A6A6LYB0_HEVBR|nr:hypothetical protein GH714_018112 [Hevea brasiliensis]